MPHSTAGSIQDLSRRETRRVRKVGVKRILTKNKAAAKLLQAEITSAVAEMSGLKIHFSYLIEFLIRAEDDWFIKWLLDDEGHKGKKPNFASLAKILKEENKKGTKAD